VAATPLNYSVTPLRNWTNGICIPQSKLDITVIGRRAIGLSIEEVPSCCVDGGDSSKLDTGCDCDELAVIIISA
jgi:hypothetical protein